MSNMQLASRPKDAQMYLDVFLLTSVHRLFFLAVRYHRHLFEIVLELHTQSLRQYIVGTTTYPPSSLRGGHKVTGLVDYVDNAPPLRPLLPAGWKNWGMVVAVEVDSGGLSLTSGCNKAHVSRAQPRIPRHLKEGVSLPTSKSHKGSVAPSG